MSLHYGNSWASIAGVLGIALLLTPAAQGAQFQLGTIIRAGFNASNAANWEIAVGDTPGATADTSSLSSYWNNGEDRRVEIEFLKPTNTVNVRVYESTLPTSTFTQVSYVPTGAASVAANAVWTLPASSFFVTATTGPTQATSIQISNLTLSGVTGAISTIQPIQQTTLLASRTATGPTASITQSGDIVFQADSGGNWLLTGELRLTGIQGGGRATGAELALSVAATASDIPEPATSSLILLGGLAIWGLHHNNRLRGIKS